MRFQIPGALREFSGGRSEIEIESGAATVNDALSVCNYLFGKRLQKKCRS